MNNRSTVDLNINEISILSCFDDPRYAKLAIENRVNYETNQPFPHICFDNFLPPDIADVIGDEYPKIHGMSKHWKYHDNKNVRRYFLENTTQFSTRMKMFASAITSRSFLLFLETLTGIPALLPDPYLMGGGAMVTGKGGFLNVHVDFNWHQKIQAWRRCNVLFYLTPDWEECWGGNLELWSTDGSRKVKEISPLFNRVVIFSTTSESYHGQPIPISSPDEKYRHVFSAFYYATAKSDKIDNHPHFTKYNADNNDLQAKTETSPYAERITQEYVDSGSV